MEREGGDLMPMSGFPTRLLPVEYRMKPFQCDDFRNIPRPYASVAFVKSGNAFYETERGNFELCAGDVLFVPEGGTYISHWSGEPPVLFALHFTFDTGVRRYFVQPVKNCPELEAAFERMIVLWKEILAEAGIGWVVSVLSPEEPAPSEKRFLICELAARGLGAIWERLYWEPAKELDPRIASAVGYIKERFAENFSVAELAAVSHMSESRFYALFREQVGVPPINYRLKVRIMKAERLLRENRELTISGISESLGFENDAYFRRVFKTLTGVPPGKYRDMEPGM